MIDSKISAKIAQLFALASNAGASSEEARTAAHVMVKLMAEHKVATVVCGVDYEALAARLTVQRDDARQDARTLAAQINEARRDCAGLTETITALHVALAKARTAQSAPTAASQAPKTAPSNDTAPAGARRPRGAAYRGKARRMLAKFPGKCACGCTASIFTGDEIMYDGRATLMACWDSMANAAE